jgi:hypothetical protein
MNRIRIVSGNDWEFKANKVLEEEAVDGFVICDLAVSCYEPSEYGSPIGGVLVIVFEKRECKNK